MENLLLLPPVAFVILLAVMAILARVAASVAHPPKPEAGKDEPYACGENVKAEKAAPDYGGFFPFAIFFTVMHVAALMVATWATVGTPGAMLGSAYIISVGLTLALLFVG